MDESQKEEYQTVLLTTLFHYIRKRGWKCRK
jgi:hypothetical protein